MLNCFPGGTAFASCFLCKETGHLSRNCPSNPHGIYPKVCFFVTFPFICSILALKLMQLWSYALEPPWFIFFNDIIISHILAKALNMLHQDIEFSQKSYALRLFALCQEIEEFEHLGCSKLWWCNLLSLAMPKVLVSATRSKIVCFWSLGSDTVGRKL